MVNGRVKRTTPVLLLALFAVLSLSAQDDGGGVRRFALFVGANDGGSERVTLRYAVTDAARVADVMYTVGGVEPADARLLQNPDGPTIDRTMEWIAGEIGRAKGAAKRVEFLFYYSGHSDEEGLLLGNEQYRYRELRNAIESVDADVAVAMLDSCSSGSFTRLKGGRRGQPFLIHDTADMTGYAFLTSSSDNEASQESDEIGASFFTHYLVSGLLGAADSTGDNRVTLNEVYQYAFTETLTRTSGTFAGPQHPSYEIQLTGAGDLVLTDLAQGNSRITLDSDVSGRIFVREDQRGRIVAEFEKYYGESTDIVVPSGDYRVERRGADGMSIAFISAGSFGPVTLSAEHFSSMRLERNRIRGDGSLDDPLDDLGDLWDRTSRAVGDAGRATWDAFGRADPIHSAFVPENPRTLQREPFVLDVIPGTRLVPSPSLPEGESVHNVVLGVLAAESGYTDGIMASLGMNLGTGVTRGIEWSYVGNIRRGKVAGIQAASFFNIHSGDISGIQSSSFLNVVDGDVRGLQISSAVGVVDGEIRGMQGGGLGAVAGYGVRGVQFGGVFAMSRYLTGVQAAVVDIAEEVRGVQAGVVNISDTVRGAQLGVVNIANDVDGITLGVLNLVRFGVQDFALTMDDRGGSWVAFQNGTERLYTVYQFGTRQSDLESEAVEFSTAAGLGTRIWSGTIYLDADLSAMVQGTGEAAFDYRGPRIFPSLRLSGGLQLGRRFAVIGGMRFDALRVFDGQEPAGTHSGDGFAIFGEGIRVYPHAFGGIKI